MNVIPRDVWYRGRRALVAGGPGLDDRRRRTIDPYRLHASA
jgi:hypothetical protein